MKLIVGHMLIIDSDTTHTYAQEMYGLSGKNSIYLNQEAGWAVVLKPWPHDLCQETPPCNLNEQIPKT